MRLFSLLCLVTSIQCQMLSVGHDTYCMLPRRKWFLDARGPSSVAAGAQIGLDDTFTLAPNDVSCWGETDGSNGRTVAVGRKRRDLNETSAFTRGDFAVFQVNDGTVPFVESPFLSRDHPTIPSLSALSLSKTADGFGCGISLTGVVGCFGEPAFGRLGDEGVSGTAWREFSLPGPVNDPPATSIATGEYHACATLEGYLIYCWGSDNFGQLGNGEAQMDVGTDLLPDDGVPLNLGPGVGAVKVVCGLQHTCVLTNQSTVMCWGDGLVGQLGTGSANETTAGNAAELPVPFTFVDLSAGDHHTCALTATGSFLCWGRGDHGRLGTGSTAHVGTAGNAVTSSSLVTLAEAVVEIAAGPTHTCVVLASGSFQCFGQQLRGSHGTGLTDSSFAQSPVSLPGRRFDSRAALVSVAAQRESTCFADECARVYCVGDGAMAGTGRRPVVGNSALGVKKVQFSFPRGAVSVALGVDHTCVVLAPPDGVNPGSTAPMISCWGRSADGKLGVAPGTNFFPTIPRLRGAEAAAETVRVDVTFDEDAADRAGGDDGGGGGAIVNVSRSTLTLPPPVKVATGDVAVSLGARHSCALVSGDVLCWGYGGDRALFSGTSRSVPSSGRLDDTPYTSPSPLVNLTGPALAVATGERTTCFLLNDTSVACVGDNSLGALGVLNNKPANEDPAAPLLVVSQVTKGASEVCVGPNYGCALVEDMASVQCWGDNSTGQLGGVLIDFDGNDAAALIDLGGTGSSLTCGGGHACVVVGGVVKCWGANDVGQLGVSGPPVMSPGSSVPNLPSIMRVSAGARHTCAVTAVGHLYCWGDGSRGALGYGNTDDVGLDITPEEVGIVSVGGRVTHFAAGTDRTCAIISGGIATCWGVMEDGDVQTTEVARPVRATGSLDLTCDPTHPLPPPASTSVHKFKYSFPPDLGEPSKWIAGDLDGDGVPDLAVTYADARNVVDLITGLATLPVPTAADAVQPLPTVQRMVVPQGGKITNLAALGGGDAALVWKRADGSSALVVVRDVLGAMSARIFVDPTTSTSNAVATLSSFEGSGKVILQDGVPHTLVVPILLNGPPVDLDGDGLIDSVFGMSNLPQLIVQSGVSASSPLRLDLGSSDEHVRSLVSLGDVSGDGVDDLAIVVETIIEPPTDFPNRVLVIIFGRVDFDPAEMNTLATSVTQAGRAPDVRHVGNLVPSFLTWRLPGLSSVVPLGDIDGDGISDTWLEVKSDAVVGGQKVKGGILLYGGVGLTTPMSPLQHSWSPYARRFRWRVHADAASDVSEDDSHVYPVGDVDGDGRVDLALITGVGDRDAPLADASLSERVLLLLNDAWALHNWYDELAGETVESVDELPRSTIPLSTSAHAVIDLGPVESGPTRRRLALFVGNEVHVAEYSVEASGPSTTADSPTTLALTSSTLTQRGDGSATASLGAGGPGVRDGSDIDGGGAGSSVVVVLVVTLLLVLLIVAGVGGAYLWRRRQQRDQALATKTLGVAETSRNTQVPRASTRQRSRQASVSHLSRTRKSDPYGSIELNRDGDSPAGAYQMMQIAPVTAYGETTLTDGDTPTYNETSLYSSPKIEY